MSAPDVSVERMRARYRIAAAPAGTRERLDAILAEVVGSSLEPALRRLAVDPREEICIDAVAARVRLRLGATDAAAGAAWSAGIAEAIARARAAGGPGVVRYASRRQALADLVAGVARDDLGRAWAWRQLGLWQAPAAPAADRVAAEAVRALRVEPEAIVPVLALIARAGLFGVFARRIGAGGLVMVAAAALEAAGASVAAALVPPGRAAGPSPLGGAARGRGPEPLEAAPAGAGGAAAAAAVRVADASSIAAAVAMRPAKLVDEPVALNAVVALAALECEPAALRSSEAATAALVAALTVLLRGRRAAGGGEHERREPDEVAGGGPRSHGSGARPAPSAPSGADGERGASRGDARPGGDAAAERGGEGPPALAGESGHASPDVHSRERGSAPGHGDAGAPHERAARLEAEADDHRVLTDDFGRTRALTGAGGVLFLLHLVDELDLAAALAEAPELVARSPRWSLHRLGMALAGAAADDPAALAFAGLGPDERPPGAEDPPPDEHERDAIAAAAARVVRRLRERLDRPDDPSPALLAEVCARRAEIVHDPGWIEARMSLDEVSLDLRRAGLDLDPGWLPWLGTIVRFVYA